MVALLEAWCGDSLMPWVVCVTEPGSAPFRYMRTDYQEEAEHFAERVRKSAQRNERDLIVVAVEWEEPPTEG